MPKDQRSQKEISLKVEDLTNRNEFGRGIVTISAKNMKDLGLKEGDYLEIEGKRKNAAIVIKSSPNDSDGIIKMDWIERVNSRSKIGETVQVRKCEIKPAIHITIAPKRTSIIIHMGGNLFKQNSMKRAFLKDNIFIPNPAYRDNKSSSKLKEMFKEMSGLDLGNLDDFDDFLFSPFGEEKFIVIKTDPEDFVFISKDTDFELLPQSPDSPKVDKMKRTFEAVDPSEFIVDVKNKPDLEKMQEVKTYDQLEEIMQTYSLSGQIHMINRYQDDKVIIYFIDSYYYLKNKKAAK